MKNNAMTKTIVHLAGILFLITAIVAGLLGFVNSITEERIAAIKLEKMQTAMREIAPDADEFVPIEGLTPADGTIGAVYEIRTGGVYAGLCVQVAPNGFGGAISMMVGVDAEGSVLGARITGHTETAGLGSKTNDAQWLSQFDGLSGTLALGSDVVAVSGATISSRAVLSGVQSVLDFAATYQGGANG